MGKTVSKEEVKINIPVESKHIGDESYAVHRFHTDTLKGAVMIMLFLLLIITVGIICAKKCLKRQMLLSRASAPIREERVIYRASAVKALPDIPE